MTRAVLASLAIGLMCAAPAHSQQGVPFESRIAAVETLIERSSAARQIDTTAVPAALERRMRARETLRAAQDAQRGGDAANAERMLSDARRLLVEAARLAAPESVTSELTNRDFDRRLESTRALLGAQKRVSAEKGEAVKGEEAARAAQQRIDAALRLRAEGRLGPAREQLDQAYLIAKASVGALRSGDTLIRSLNFATKEEEYRYEVDRNDTHQMLVKVLLQGRANGNGGQPVAAFVERARSLRADAEALAARGQHAEAVKQLEASTSELVKAIRGAGVYIPG